MQSGSTGRKTKTLTCVDHWPPLIVGPCLIRGLSVYTDLLNTKTEPFSQKRKIKLERKEGCTPCWTVLFCSVFRKVMNSDQVGIQGRSMFLELNCLFSPGSYYFMKVQWLSKPGPFSSLSLFKAHEYSCVWVYGEARGQPGCHVQHQTRLRQDLSLMWNSTITWTNWPVSPRHPSTYTPQPGDYKCSHHAQNFQCRFRASNSGPYVCGAST